MKYFHLLIFFAAIVSLNSCDNTSNKSEETTITDSTQITTPPPTAAISEDAYSLLQTRCLICHTDKNLPHDQLIAPPMAAVKNRYADITGSKEEFVNRLVEFTLTPSVDEAMMYGAVRRFNLMTPVMLPEDTLRKIAAFLYETDISAPDWFASHYKQMHPEGQPNMSLAIVDKIQEINDQVQALVAGKSGLAMEQSTFENLKAMAEKVESTGEQDNLQQYHEFARSLAENLPEESSSEAVKAYLEVLKEKLSLMQNAKLKEEAEFILLHIRRQLQMLDQHFVIK